MTQSPLSIDPGLFQALIASFSEAAMPEEVLACAVSKAREITGSSGAAIWLMRDKVHALDLGAVVGSHHVVASMRVLVGDGIVGTAALRREAVSVAKGQWDDADKEWAEAGIAAGVAVPVIWQETLMGVIACWDENPGREFAAQDVDMMQLVAQVAAPNYTAIDLRDSIAVEKRRLESLHDAIRTAFDEADLKGRLQHIASSLRNLGWKRVVLSLGEVACKGSEIVVVSSADKVEVRVEEPLLPDDICEAYEKGDLEEYRSHGMYFVPASNAASSLWQADDVLFAPLHAERIRRVGLVRLFDPIDGQRPIPEMIFLLDILVSQAVYIVENTRLLEEASRAADELAEQIDELSMIHRANRELTSHLDVERVVRLAIDWAVRRTAADAVVISMVTEDGHGTVPFMTLGPVSQVVATYNEDNQWPVDRGVTKKAIETRQVQLVRDFDEAAERELFSDAAKSLLVVPLAMRGEVLGVIALVSQDVNAFDENDISFMERLGRRTAVALDNSRLYRQVKQMAEDMSALYAAGRAISSTLERGAALALIAQVMVETLECSCAVILDLQPDMKTLQVQAHYQIAESQDEAQCLPNNREIVLIDGWAALREAVETKQPILLQASDPKLSAEDSERLNAYRVKTLLLLPLVAQDELFGAAMVADSRVERRFKPNEMAKANALASQVSVALRQSKLYSEILELERIKTEMIRMASHDIRNPLNNVMGYLKLLERNLEQTGIAPEQRQYLDYLDTSTRIIKSMIEDLLTLERVESERGENWQSFDIGQLVGEVYDSLMPGAKLKQQTLEFEVLEGHGMVHGSIAQLRQAIVNLVSNAVKYTPDGGRIMVTCYFDADRCYFAVKDNGYGIDPERQSRVFERFYRARMPGTEHITGTGLGLSLVKTVVERHGGKVWFESAAGAGSTFGFWLPAVAAPT